LSHCLIYNKTTILDITGKKHILDITVHKDEAQRSY